MILSKQDGAVDYKVLHGDKDKLLRYLDNTELVAAAIYYDDLHGCLSKHGRLELQTRLDKVGDTVGGSENIDLHLSLSELRRLGSL